MATINTKSRPHQSPDQHLQDGDFSITDRPDELLTIPQVLAELGDVARSTFYRWRATGRGPKTQRLPNGQLRIWRSDLRSWLDARTA